MQYWMRIIRGLSPNTDGSDSTLLSSTLSIYWSVSSSADAGFLLVFNELGLDYSPVRCCCCSLKGELASSGLWGCLSAEPLNREAPSPSSWKTPTITITSTKYWRYFRTRSGLCGSIRVGPSSDTKYYMNWSSTHTRHCFFLCS